MWGPRTIYLLISFYFSLLLEVHSDGLCELGGLKGCNVHCSTAHGKLALLNSPWAIGACVEGNCVCRFNEKQIRNAIPKNCIKFYFSLLESEKEIVEEMIEEKFSKLSLDKKFEWYMNVYEKSYSTKEEKGRRLRIFEENLVKISELNANRKGSVVYGIGPFTDLSSQEFAEKYIGKQDLPSDLSDKDDESGQLQTRTLTRKGKGKGKGKERNSTSPPRRKPSGSRSPGRSRARSLSPQRSSSKPSLQRTASGYRRLFPARFRPAKTWDPEYRPMADGMSRRPRHNFRMDPGPSEGAPMIFGNPPIGDPITDWRIPPELYPPAEHQDLGNKRCGSCWAFAALGAVEMHWALLLNRVVMLSKQDLVDCVPENDGCVNGDIGKALLHMKIFGVSRAVDYPYVAETQDCNPNIPGYMSIGDYDEIKGDKNVEDALDWTPVPAGVHAPDELQFYVSGVYESAACSNKLKHMGHAVAIVGHYQDAWIIRNSWGPTWGLEGHYLVKKGHCGAGKRCWTVKGPFTLVK
nr:PREDICTED: cathepsin L-like [Bemisia tabaci]